MLSVVKTFIIGILVAVSLMGATQTQTEAHTGWGHYFYYCQGQFLVREEFHANRYYYGQHYWSVFAKPPVIVGSCY